MYNHDQDQFAIQFEQAKAARRFARESEAQAHLRLRTLNREISAHDRAAYQECLAALRIVQSEVNATRSRFLDSFYH